MKRDHAKLICDIGELSGLFEDVTTLETFLQKIVEMVSEHMHSEVCSIYLFYEETQELVLKATKGLHPDSIGKVSLKLGEGLTGLAVQELRPICEKNASKTAGYRYFPGIGEEKYESFLAVPILRGQTRIGALVIQNARKSYFSEEDVAAFRAITSQLANTIETAKLLMSLNEGTGHKQEADSGIERSLSLIKGLVGSEGFALAEAFVLDHASAFTRLQEEGKRKHYTLGDFYRAVQCTERQLDDFQKQIEETFSDVASLIFTAQILMLKDKDFMDAIVQQIKNQVNPPQAIIHTVENYVHMFEGLPNAYLQEKKQDVKDIGRRLLGNLVGDFEHQGVCRNRIVIARELFPSDVLKMSSQGVKGLILLSGGVTSHLSILARSLEIPLIIAETHRLLQVPPGTQILMDAEQGSIYVDPSEDVIRPFRKKEEDRAGLNRMKAQVKDVTRTKDGTRITLLANINLLCDLKTALAFKAEGVGLYRTEFPFMVRSDFPTEEEQFIIYKKFIESMPGKEMTFRTLDIGGDKVLSYYDYGKEENPFLGMRSIRFSLKHKEVFRQQLRAILRAGCDADLRIMFPMISSVDEFLDAKEVVVQSIQEIQKEGTPCHRKPLIGMMVELPAVLPIIDDLAREADFFSIGTNDFIQYMLAVDRTNEKVAEFYLPHHPAILRGLKMIVDAAIAQKKDVTICGDMVQDKRYTPYFLGIGIRKMSLNSRYFPRIQQIIENIDLNEAREKTKQLLRQHKIRDINKLLPQ